MFSRDIVIKPQILSLLVNYPSEIVEKDSQITIHFYHPEDDIDSPSNTIQVNHSLLGQIIQFCRMNCPSNDMLVIEYHSLFDSLDRFVKEDMTQAA